MNLESECFLSFGMTSSPPLIKVERDPGPPVEIAHEFLSVGTEQANLISKNYKPVYDSRLSITRVILVRKVILSGGQNVIDAKKNTSFRNSINVAQKLLEWGHLCPTAPDTLALHPTSHEEALVIDRLPNIFIVGGQKRFKIREWKGTFIVTLPKFSDTGIAVVLDKCMNFVPLNIRVLNK
ncbi:DNA polymerase delta small subunit [Folsomia candida]|uniref:DNA polymerase delta small subunit n=1 Tax=Folsomia candida TaxID=158441 RepID=A0A226EQ84_FOLCA|nr:DNA polymerase delta small subunit [Folsomia candida]